METGSVGLGLSSLAEASQIWTYDERFYEESDGIKCIKFYHILF